MKAEAALLIALADIGGVWPVARVTAALTEVADDALGAARALSAARGGRARQARRRRSATIPKPARGYIVLAMGKMGGGRAEFFQRHRSDGVFRCRRARRSRRDVEPAPFFVRVTRELVEAAAGAHRRRLRVPRRSAAAARSGLDPDRDLDRRRARLLRAAAARTGNAPR